MNVTILRQLKNTNNEKDLLDREITRMQNIDRAKVAQARNSFYNPDTKSLLPTLDTMFASTGPGGHTGTPSIGQPSLDQFGSQFPQDLGTTQREIVTANELKGVCERFGTRPSQRHRIVIARSQEQHTRGRTVTDRSIKNPNGPGLNNFLQ